jgi:hypothetical protein
MSETRTVEQRLEWACKHYCDWYEGKVAHADASDVAYALVSEIRHALAALRAPQEPGWPSDREAAIRWLDAHDESEAADRVRASACKCASQCRPYKKED